MYTVAKNQIERSEGGEELINDVWMVNELCGRESENIVYVCKWVDVANVEAMVIWKR